MYIPVPIEIGRGAVWINQIKVPDDTLVEFWKTRLLFPSTMLILFRYKTFGKTVLFSHRPVLMSVLPQATNKNFIT